MVETIAPVVHGGSRSRYLRSIAVHTVFAAFSAGLVGFLLGGLASLTGGPWDGVGPWILAAVAAVYSVAELTGVNVPLPNRKAQVPVWWRTFYGPDVAAALYGFGLGPGFLTYLGFGTYAAVLTGAFLSADPFTGALITAPFGIARALAILAGSRAKDAEESAIVVDRLLRLGSRRPVEIAHGLLLALVVAAAFL